MVLKIAKVTIEHFPSRAEAQAAEKEAVRRENPKHNLQRFTVKETAEAVDRAAEHSGVSKADLVETVTYAPVYTIDEAAEALCMVRNDVSHYIATGELGHIVLGESIKPHKTTKVPTVYQKIGVTGWQLIDFVEVLERQSLTGQQLLSKRPKGADLRLGTLSISTTEPHP